MAIFHFPLPSPFLDPQSLHSLDFLIELNLSLVNSPSPPSCLDDFESRLVVVGERSDLQRQKGKRCRQQIVASNLKHISNTLTHPLCSSFSLYIYIPIDHTHQPPLSSLVPPRLLDHATWILMKNLMTTICIMNNLPLILHLRTSGRDDQYVQHVQQVNRPSTRLCPHPCLPLLPRRSYARPKP